VLDPVLASGRGDEFGGEDLVAAIRELLVPQSTVVTPNIPELRRLALVDDDEEPDHAECARRLLDAGLRYVLVTGTHDATAAVVKYAAPSRRHSCDPTPGNGCRAATTVRVHARLRDRGEPRPGLDVADAVHEAQDYTWQALAKAFRPAWPVHPGPPLLGARRR